MKTSRKARAKPRAKARVKRRVRARTSSCATARAKPVATARARSRAKPASAKHEAAVPSLSNVGLFDMDGSLADYEGALRRDLAAMAMPGDPDLKDMWKAENRYPAIGARMKAIKARCKRAPAPFNT